MASSDNLPSLEPWMFRPAFPADPWFSDAFALDADALTKALTHSISAPTQFSPSDNSLYDVLNAVVNSASKSNPSSDPNTPRCGGQSISISGCGSGSDPEKVSKRSNRGNAPGPASGRVGKRKSRASKKSPTTFITADPANFRQMVQQVTGVKFPAAAAAAQIPSMVTPILKPEPKRIDATSAAVIGSRIQGCLPTLDTSAFLLDHHQQVVGQGSHVGTQSGTASSASAVPSVGEIGSDGGARGVGGGAGGLDFGSFSCFPILDSWKVM